MPFTPFHFGPGLFGKSLAPRYFSWTAFVATQVIIDFETLHHLLRHTFPVHGFFHTLLGATIIGLLTGLLLVAVRWMLHRSFLETNRFSYSLKPWIEGESSSGALMIGAFVGGVSHPLLDGIMHSDVRPFSPWSEANPLLRLVGQEALHFGCLFLGLIGLLILFVRLPRKKEAP